MRSFVGREKPALSQQHYAKYWVKKKIQTKLQQCCSSTPSKIWLRTTSKMKSNEIDGHHVTFLSSVTSQNAENCVQHGQFYQMRVNKIFLWLRHDFS